jgi:hypothetical protein
MDGSFADFNSGAKSVVCRKRALYIQSAEARA